MDEYFEQEMKILGTDSFNYLQGKFGLEYVKVYYLEDIIRRIYDLEIDPDKKPVLLKAFSKWIKVRQDKYGWEITPGTLNPDNKPFKWFLQETGYKITQSDVLGVWIRSKELKSLEEQLEERFKLLEDQLNESFEERFDEYVEERLEPLINDHLKKAEERLKRIFEIKIRTKLRRYQLTQDLEPQQQSEPQLGNEEKHLDNLLNFLKKQIGVEIYPENTAMSREWMKYLVKIAADLKMPEFPVEYIKYLSKRYYKYKSSYSDQNRVQERAEESVNQHLLKISYAKSFNVFSIQTYLDLRGMPSIEDIERGNIYKDFEEFNEVLKKAEKKPHLKTKLKQQRMNQQTPLQPQHGILTHNF